MREDDIGDEKKVVEGSEEETSCRHITIHPDQLLTTAIVDGLRACTQYIVRYFRNIFTRYHHLDEQGQVGRVDGERGEDSDRSDFMQLI